ncbi:MAG TPA: HAMP domain-containing sensor histidine kinase [Williamwhitmania sp.]|nr:HAMP domain-containing sensor histidine kinase [Williamwhitmania sp.]
MKKLTDEELINELTKRFEENKRSFLEMQELNKEFQLVNKKLEESESLKSHFISNITNEIVNPFTSIIGLSRAILSVDKENWKKVISMVALIHTEAFHLDFQLRNIFVAAKIEAGEVVPEVMEVDIRSLIDSVIDAYKIEAKKKRVVISAKFGIPGYSGVGPYNFKTDPEKLKLILSNLISNAVKYSFDDGTIELNILRDSNVLAISVVDHGTGVSEINQSIIFDRFKRVDTGINSINRGHGLGLSINRALLDVLDGSIEVSSQEGHGATFTISIPEATNASEGFAADDNEFFFGEEPQVF